MMDAPSGRCVPPSLQCAPPSILCGPPSPRCIAPSILRGPPSPRRVAPSLLRGPPSTCREAPSILCGPPSRCREAPSMPCGRPSLRCGRPSTCRVAASILRGPPSTRRVAPSIRRGPPSTCCVTPSADSIAPSLREAGAEATGGFWTVSTGVDTWGCGGRLALLYGGPACGAITVCCGAGQHTAPGRFPRGPWCLPLAFRRCCASEAPLPGVMNGTRAGPGVRWGRSGMNRALGASQRRQRSDYAVPRDPYDHLRQAGGDAPVRRGQCIGRAGQAGWGQVAVTAGVQELEWGELRPELSNAGDGVSTQGLVGPQPPIPDLHRMH